MPNRKEIDEKLEIDIPCLLSRDPSDQSFCPLVFKLARHPRALDDPDGFAQPLRIRRSSRVQNLTF
jgi:hypothetical protein